MTNNRVLFWLGLTLAFCASVVTVVLGAGPHRQPAWAIGTLALAGLGATQAWLARPRRASSPDRQS